MESWPGHGHHPALRTAPASCSSSCFRVRRAKHRGLSECRVCPRMDWDPRSGFRGSKWLTAPRYRRSRGSEAGASAGGKRCIPPTSSPPETSPPCPGSPQEQPHPHQRLEHYLRQAALLCSVRRRCPPLSPRSCGRGRPARSPSHSTSRHRPRPGGTLRRKHEGAPKFPAQERRSPSPPTLQAFLAVRQKLCFTESRHWRSHPAALSPGSPPAPRPFPGTHRGGEGTEARGGAHGRFPHPLPPHTRSLLPRGKRLLPAQEWPKVSPSAAWHSPPHPLLLPQEVLGVPQQRPFPSAKPPPRPRARRLPAYYFCFLHPFKG